MNSKSLAIAVMTTAFTATMVSAHLPSANVARQQMGRAHIAVSETSTRAVVDISTIKNWPAAPKDAKEVETGFYVKHGTDRATGEPMYWKASWWPEESDEPGQFADSGGTSAWALQNSMAFNRGEEYMWTGWNDNAKKWEITRRPGTWEYDEKEVGTWGAQIESKGPGAYVPTWRDGAEGAYTMIHDDIGAMSFEGSVQPANEVGDEHKRIRVGWGVKVDVMDADEWQSARDMVKDGHEMLNHSWDHSSAAEQWQWHFPGAVLSPEDPALPKEIRGLTVGEDGGQYPTKLDIKVPYIDYINGDPNQPDTAYSSVTFYVSSDYKFDSTIVEREDTEGNVWEEVVYESSGKIKPEHKGWSDDAGKAVPMLKIFAVPGWAGQANREQVNVDVAKEVMDKECYSKVVSPRHPKGKVTEYYVYPYDAYSTATHDRVYQGGHIASRGGAKSGMPIPGDFYQPFRIDFDAFYMLDERASVVYPDNPHQRLSLEGLVDRIVKTKGYMIREFHACADVAYWDDANKQSMGGWWGGIPKSLYKEHFEAVDKLIDENKITVFTPTEAVRYRLTANSVTGANYSGTTLTVDASGCKPEYQDEISVIVVFDKGYDKVSSIYADGELPRYAPRKMNDDGSAWSISVNPYYDNGKIEVTPGEEQPVGVATQAVKAGVSHRITDNQVSLNLAEAGTYKVDVFSVAGRKIASTNVTGTAGLVKTGISTSDLGAGMFILNVSKAGAAVMNAKFLVK